MSKQALLTRVYRKALEVVLPRHIVERDGGEMVELFDDLASDQTGALGRFRLLARCLAGLLQVGLLEHLALYKPLPVSPNGNRTATKEHTMSRVISDLRFALRTLKRAPAYAVSSVFLLALGIGAVTSIFTLFDNILLRSLPYPDDQRIVVVEDGSHTGPMWREFQAHESIDTWAAAWTLHTNLTGQGDPIGIEVAQISEDFFKLFGGNATVGRLFAPDDFETPNRVVLAFDFWRDTFGADRDGVGKTIQLNGESVLVLGVVERSFVVPEALVGATVHAWRPMPWADESFQSPNYYVIEIAGRLAEGRTLEQFRGETQAAIKRLDEADSDTTYRDRDGNIWQMSVAHLRDVTVRSARIGLVLLLGAVGLLLLIACSNVAHLAVARGLSRTKEMAVRRALGASTGSLLRQLLVESLVVALVGGALGVALAAVAVRAFLAIMPMALPRGANLSLDLRIVAFAAGISILTTLIFGLLPALLTVKTLGADQQSRTMSQGRSSRWLRNGLVSLEVAMSMMLLVGAGVLLRSYSIVNQQEAGIVTEGVWRIPLSPPEEDEVQTYLSQMAEIRTALETVPGVSSVAHGLTLPFSFVGGQRCCWRSRIAPTQTPEETTLIAVHPVSTDYFSTLGITFSAGSAWSSAGATQVPIPVVLPQTSASELFGSPEKALGKSLSLGSMPELEVVGIARDVRHYGLDQQSHSAVYLPIERLPFGMDLADFAVKLDGPPPAGFTRSLRTAIWSAAPDLPVPTVQRMDVRVAESTAERRFESVLFSGFGAVALLLAAAGLYGTLLYAVGQRTREMGIRLALGAKRRTVAAHVLLSGATVALIGAGLGLCGAWGATTLLESRIWGVDARDTASLVGSTVLLMVTAVMASWVPALKAGRTDPVEALRAE